jgi:hypothetical protein
LAFRCRVLSEGSDRSQPTSLDLIFISELPGFGFHEAIFRLYALQEQNGLYLIGGEGLLLYKCKKNIYNVKELYKNMERVKKIK